MLSEAMVCVQQVLKPAQHTYLKYLSDTWLSNHLEIAAPSACGFDCFDFLDSTPCYNLRMESPKWLTPAEMPRQTKATAVKHGCKGMHPKTQFSRTIKFSGAKFLKPTD